MNKKTSHFVKTIGLLAAVAISIPAQAQFFAGHGRMAMAGGGENSPFSSPGHRGGDPMVLFDRIDSNGDGLLSLEEVLDARSARAEKRFTRTDENADGVISLEEFVARAAQRPPRDVPSEEVIACVEERTGKDLPDPAEQMSPEEKFAGLDTDGDGLLTQEELSATVTAHVTERFNAQDTDGDGFVSSDEFLAAAEERAALREAWKACREEASQDGEILDALATDSLKQIGF